MIHVIYPVLSFGGYSIKYKVFDTELLVCDICDGQVLMKNAKCSLLQMKATFN